jgi:plastocyanin
MNGHTILLTYREPKKGKALLKGEYNDGSVTGQPRKLKCQVGDTLAFESSQGYPVTVKMEKPRGMFSPNVFSTDPKYCRTHKIKCGAPVKFKKLGEFQYCCGFVDDGKTYGYPRHKRLGNTGQGGT